MTSTPCRRDLLLIAAAGVAAAPALALTSTPTLAYQGNMERALSALEAAMQSLQASTPNKGGHRERAMRLIEHAMGEVQARSVVQRRRPLHGRGHRLFRARQRH
jgi:hypothetical protein